MNLERLYAHRFRDVEQEAKAGVWAEIAPHVHGLMGRPSTMLDPAAGRGEFISRVPAPERWAVDMVAYPEADYGSGTRVITSEIMAADLPPSHFEGVFVSNFLEHLADQEAVADFLERMHQVTAPGGRIAIMGPNYRYASRVYWDFADHRVALTHKAIDEHLYAAGFEPQTTIPRYLPYTATGRLPASPKLTRAYLRLPLAWRVLGKQFLVIGRKEA